MCLAYLLIFLAALMAEAASMVVIGSYLGVLWTLGGLAAGVAVGVLILSGHGVRTVQTAAKSIAAKKSIGPVMVDSALIGLAGLLFVFPGFASDAVALFLLLPPTRFLVRRRIVARFQAEVERVAGAGAAAGAGAGDIIDTTATEATGAPGDDGGDAGPPGPGRGLPS